MTVDFLPGAGPGPGGGGGGDGEDRSSNPGSIFSHGSAMISSCPLEMGYVNFTLLDSPTLPNVFASWRPVSIAMYYICMGVLLIIGKYFSFPGLYL